MSLQNRLLQRIRSLSPAVRHLRALYRQTAAVENPAEAIRQRLARRREGFLEAVERTVLADETSPYRVLLEVAGVTFPQVAQWVRAEGLEPALRRLSERGVYLSIEEFKGQTELRRGGRTFRFQPRDFDNPLVRGGLTVITGGTRSEGIPSRISLADHQMGVEHLAVALEAYGLLGRPMAVWLTRRHAAALWAATSLSVLSRRPVRWFTIAPVEAGSFYPLLRLAVRPLGIRLPAETYLPFGRESRILDWTRRGEARRGCGIVTMPSMALRLALAAAKEGADLAHLTFITVGEPLTDAKYAAIRSVGGRAFSSLGFAEFGRASYGCASPATADETHLCGDAVAVVPRARPVGPLAAPVNALLFTTLWPHARKILLNVETGDYASVGTRQCGCPLERLGWTDHLQGIRSFEKLNAEGRLFFGSDLYVLVEETLPQRFGGEPTDYQLVEEEDREGFTRLTLLVDSRLGPLDEGAVLDAVYAHLATLGQSDMRVWRQADTLRLRRAAPLLTPAGKFMPLHHLKIA
jgi:hypothetical protein